MGRHHLRLKKEAMERRPLPEMFIVRRIPLRNPPSPPPSTGKPPIPAPRSQKTRTLNLRPVRPVRRTSERKKPVPTPRSPAVIQTKPKPAIRMDSVPGGVGSQVARTFMTPAGTMKTLVVRVPALTKTVTGMERNRKWTRRVTLDRIEEE